MHIVVAMAAATLLQQTPALPSPVPPPPVQGVANCERPSYATEHLICDTPSLRQTEVRLGDLWRRTDGLIVPSAWIESQEDWFRRRATCAFREDHASCVEAANAERFAVLEAVTAPTPTSGDLMVCHGQDGDHYVHLLRHGTVALERKHGGFTLAASPSSPAWTPYLATTDEGRKLVRFDGESLDCRKAN